MRLARRGDGKQGARFSVALIAPLPQKRAKNIQIGGGRSSRPCLGRSSRSHPFADMTRAHFLRTQYDARVARRHYRRDGKATPLGGNASGDCSRSTNGATVAERLHCSPPTNADRDSIPGRFIPDFWQVGIVPDDAAGRRVFSRVSPPFHSGAAPYSPHFTLIGSQDHDVTSHPNLFTYSQAISSISVAHTARVRGSIVNGHPTHEMRHAAAIRARPQAERSFANRVVLVNPRRVFSAGGDLKRGLAPASRRVAKKDLIRTYLVTAMAHLKRVAVSPLSSPHFPASNTRRASRQYARKLTNTRLVAITMSAAGDGEGHNWRTSRRPSLPTPMRDSHLGIKYSADLVVCSADLCSFHKTRDGAAVAERLDCLPPTKASSLRIFASRNRAGQCR
ncbi:hypothetical protein PR048_019231 [Dryococelus australis]|uniref:Uncharacterized protein n=1 Tax=Dryococelus australis TaxID=614101 RepID=A0ABQ9H365_9NEOP|nr:hypothetical protein PR048_019231 [Dryococelus australis]